MGPASAALANSQSDGASERDRPERCLTTQGTNQAKVTTGSIASPGRTSFNRRPQVGPTEEEIARKMFFDYRGAVQKLGSHTVAREAMVAHDAKRQQFRTEAFAQAERDRIAGREDFLRAKRHATMGVPEHHNSFVPFKRELFHGQLGNAPSSPIRVPIIPAAARRPNSAAAAAAAASATAAASPPMAFPDTAFDPPTTGAAYAPPFSSPLKPRGGAMATAGGARGGLSLGQSPGQSPGAPPPSHPPPSTPPPAPHERGGRYRLEEVHPQPPMSPMRGMRGMSGAGAGRVGISNSGFGNGEFGNGEFGNGEFGNGDGDVLRREDLHDEDFEAFGAPLDDGHVTGSVVKSGNDVFVGAYNR